MNPKKNWSLALAKQKVKEMRQPYWKTVDLKHRVDVMESVILALPIFQEKEIITRRK